MSSPDISLIVPAFNEAARIVPTLETLRAHLEGKGWGYEIIVSADGEDETRDRARALADPRIRVIGAPERRGKGRGIREGVRIAEGQVIGFLDADGKTPIDEIDKVLPLLGDGFDLVIGSRIVSGSRIEVPQPLYRRLGAGAFRAGMHMLVGLWGIHDTQCGFKFFRGPVAKDLFARQTIDGYMFDVEILCLARASGYRIKEVGVRWRDDGDSRSDALAGSWGNFRDLVRIRRGKSPAGRRS